MQINCDDMVNTSWADQLSDKFTSNRAAFAHFVLLTIRKVWNHKDDPPSTGGFACEGQNQKFHYVIVHVQSARLNKIHITAFTFTFDSKIMTNL